MSIESSFPLPLFPLTAHVLPGGRMALRIFEPRYLRMVKEACAQDRGFGICMLNVKGDKDENSHIYPVGTFVKVVDFELLEDGLLGITVAGERFFEIRDIRADEDGLRIGDCAWLDNFDCDIGSHELDPMDARLQEIFDNYPEVKGLYESPRFDDPQWILFRWLELLPVNAEQKQYFLQQRDCRKIFNYLAQLVQ